jgi:zinc D-Ala-D-Ala dipeptidase
MEKSAEGRQQAVAGRSRGRARCAVLPGWALLLLLAASLSAQPRETGTFRPSSLVELVPLDSTIHLDIRYATAHNFLGRPVYAQARAFLERPAAAALLRAHRALREHGYGLLVFDGYRPWSVTREFWERTLPAQRKFVANPKKGSKHNRGCAVDLSLYVLATGEEVRMPSPYDSFTESAAAAYPGGEKREREMRDFLRRTMEAEGFAVNPDEWWHFDYRDWKAYRILDVPFSAIR